MQGTTGAAPALTTSISAEALDQLCREARTFRATAPEAKEHLRPALAPNNIEKTMTAPVTGFFETFPKLFPQADARSWFAGNQALIDETAFRNTSLQGAYLTLAARALGIDCGPMSGFGAAMVNAEFFSMAGGRRPFSATSVMVIEASLFRATRAWNLRKHVSCCGQCPTLRSFEELR